MRNHLVLLPLLFLFTTACAPRYQVPQTTLAAPELGRGEETSSASFEASWWRQFDDPVLDALIEDAFVANRDLRAAAARFVAAREIAGAAGLLQLPAGGPVVTASRQRLSGAEGGEGPAATVSLVSAGFGVSWEADLFGRLRGVHQTASAEASAAAMDVRGAQVAIAAQVAAAYFELRGAQREAALVDALQASTRQELGAIRAVMAAGRGTRLDLLRMQQIDEELAGMSSVAAHRADAARNRLATLTGHRAGTLHVPAANAVPLRASALPIGSAADLLRRRPDIAAAEFRLAAAAARTGIARANLFPRVDVTGTIGLVAGSVGQLSDAAAGSWLIVPRLVWNVLDLPRLRRELRAAGAVADATFADYEHTILRAIEESHTAVDAYAAANQQLAVADRRARAAAEAAGIVAVQYREGLVDSLARMQAERDAIAGSLDANRALVAQRLAVVDLYRALGGGWR